MTMTPLQKLRVAAGLPPDPGPASEEGDTVGGIVRSALSGAEARAAAIIERALGLVVGELADIPVAPAWLSRFVRLAGDCAAQETAAFWARLLAVELAYPGTLSSHALDACARLSDADVNLLKRLAPLACNDFIPVVDEPLLETKGLTQESAGTLEDLGLMRPEQGHLKTFESQREDRFSTVLLYRDKGLRVEHPLKERKLSLRVRRLTRGGAELMAAVSAPADFDLLMALTSHLRGCGYTVEQTTLTGRAPLRNSARHTGFVEVVPFPRRGG